MTQRDKDRQRLRVGVVGLRMGEGHLQALATHPRAEIRAVCDPIEERAQEMSTTYGARGVYADFMTMLEREELDGVCIATPNRLHTPMVREAINRGLHVMCEKPLTLDTNEARELLAQARKAGITHATNFSNRPNPTVKYVKEQIDAGALGRVYEVHLTYLQDWLSDADAPYTWRNSKDDSGSGAWGDIASHMLDLSRLFVGEVSAVDARFGIVTTERPRPDGTTGRVDADDLAHAHVRYANGAFGLVRVSRVARGRCDLKRVEIYGEKASLILTMDRGVNEVRRADEATAWRGDMFRPVFVYDPTIRIWGGNVQEWVDASLARREMSPSFEDGLRCQQILDAGVRSNEEGRWADVARDE